MDYLDAVKVLRSNPLFSKLDQAKLKLLAFAAEYQTFKDGEVLFNFGEPSDCAYLIDEGNADALIEKDGREIIVNTLGRHEVIGEMGIFRNSGRSATIKAKGDLSVMRIDGDMFLSLVTENPDAALGVMRLLSEKLANTSALVEKLEGRLRSAADGGE